MRIYYQLTTLDPVIVSQSNATTNNHECLDYIPGSAILGLIASKEYAKLSEEESWQVFHNGDVQFSPCYPLIANEIALPTPSSWHFKKGEEATRELEPNNPNSIEQYTPENVTNHAEINFERDELIQYKQCRTGYLTSQGKTQKVTKGYNTKTAINRDSGSAKKSQLFSYSYIEAEQNFIGWIDIAIKDELQKSNVENKIKQNLQGIARIGRSRNTEFGRVKLSITTVEQAKQIPNNKQLTLWCLSDVELVNSMGMPTLAPKCEDIHPDLKGITLNANKSFIRGNKVSRFNQKRQGLDTEQILINKGSILTFDLNNEQNIPDKILEVLNNKGIGINRQQGLGWVYVNPAWASLDKMNSDQSLFSPLKVTLADKTEPDAAKNNIVEDSPLTLWLQEKVEQQDKVKGRQKKVNSLIQSIISLYDNARKYNGIIDSNEAGPSSSQWRRIGDIVRSHNDAKNENKWATLVFEGDNAICKANNDKLGWGINLQGTHGQTTFADEVNKLLEDKDIHTMRLLLEQLCDHDLSTFKDLQKIKLFYKNNAGSQ